MPVDLPVRKALNSQSSIPEIFDEWTLVLAALCIVVALAGLILHTPRTARAGLSVAVYEAMLQSP